jgi:hypothetical protein
MKKVKRKVPQSVKTNRKIAAAVERSLELNKRFYVGVIARRDQRHAAEIETLKLRGQPQSFAYLEPENRGWVVSNWRNWWRWWSARGLAVIAFLAVTPIPNEVLVLLPAQIRLYAIAVTAVCAFIMNFKDQKHDLTPKIKAVEHV